MDKIIKEESSWELEENLRAVIWHMIKAGVLDKQSLINYIYSINVGD